MTKVPELNWNKLIPPQAKQVVRKKSQAAKRAKKHLSEDQAKRILDKLYLPKVNAMMDRDD